MNRRLRLLFLLIFLQLSQPATVLSGQITIDSDQQFQFARHTMERGEYLRAVVEFKRFIHFFPGDKKVPEARYLIGVCYLQAKKYERARESFWALHRVFPARPIGGKALLMIGESYYRQNVFGEAVGYFKEVLETYPQTEVKNVALYRLAWSQMKTDKWREASETFSMVEKRSPLYPSSQDLSQMSLKGEELPYKDPTTAGVLAAILPGLGHAYLNRYKDGMVAFLLNGVTIWAAVEAFDEDIEVVGGILIFLELGWYGGNIYSAVNSAHKYNRKVRNDFRRSLRDRLKFRPFRPGHRQLGLALKWDF